MKGKTEVIKEFNEVVNMSAKELETWLKSEDSNSAGWPKDDANEDESETVGHDSGRKIVEILSDNPEKKPEKYTEDQVAHMRKVVSYCKRHLAQETKANSEKSPDEVKKSKSYASLKNWGHDFLKAQASHSSESEQSATPSSELGEQENEENGTEAAHTGDKRKKSDHQAGSNKKKATERTATVTRSKKRQGGSDKDDHEQPNHEDSDGEENNADEGGDEDNEGETQAESDTTPANGPSTGDKVSWEWGGGHPEGTVLEVKEERTTITTKRGNKVSRKGKQADPAVVLDTGSSKAIKLAHELD
ncbi:hypothetical protein GQ53DRAFT_886599 [Thozetella sp. PMI_491]|nr:hypothetical protein GQ53DRAFT_886599 [Thozetella sp. PMI_491]